MSTNDLTYEFVSVSEAATRLGISPTTVRERIRSGHLEAERVARPQGTVFLVKVSVQAQPTHAVPNSTQEEGQSGTDDARKTPQHEREGAAIIHEAVAPLVVRLTVADQQIAEQAQTIIAQAQLIADLREERGTLAERAEQERARTTDERARAERAEVERDTVRTELSSVRGELISERAARETAEAKQAAILAAQLAASTSTSIWWRWWPVALSLAAAVLLVLLLAPAWVR